MKKAHYKTLQHIVRLFRVMILAFFMPVAIGVQAQTPIANRVKMAARAIEKHATVVAKYTDNLRHCLYYTSENRMYKYDVVTDKTHEIMFTYAAYSRILDVLLSPDGNYLLIYVDRGGAAANYADDGKLLLRIDSRDGTIKKIGHGFVLTVTPEHLVMKRGEKIANPQNRMEQDELLVRDYHYDHDGTMIFYSDPYKMKASEVNKFAK